VTARASGHRLRGLAAVVVATLLWSLGAAAIAALFEHGVRPLQLVQLRVYVTAIGLGVVVLGGRRAGRYRTRLRDLRWAPIIGLALSVAMATTFLVLAIQQLPVAVALVLQSFAPVFVMGWTLLSTRRWPRPLAVAGVLFTLGGVALVAQLSAASPDRIHALGLLYGLAASVGVAGLSVFGARAAAVAGAARANALAFALVAIGWLLVQLPQGVPALMTEPRYLAWGTAIGVFGTIGPFVLFAWGTARLGPEAGAVDISLEPVFGAGIAWTWLGQSLTAPQVTGMILVVAGVVCVERDSADAKGDRREYGEQDAGHLERGRPLVGDQASQRDGAEGVQGHKGGHDGEVTAVDSDDDADVGHCLGGAADQRERPGGRLVRWRTAGRRFGPRPAGRGKPPPDGAGGGCDGQQDAAGREDDDHRDRTGTRRGEVQGDEVAAGREPGRHPEEQRPGLDAHAPAAGGGADQDSGDQDGTEGDLSDDADAFVPEQAIGHRHQGGDQRHQRCEHADRPDGEAGVEEPD
jgi:drug/metabolite transporter (DMT)-like permease